MCKFCKLWHACLTTCANCGNKYCPHCFALGQHSPSTVSRLCPARARQIRDDAERGARETPPSPDPLERMQRSRGTRPWFPAIH